MVSNGLSIDDAALTTLCRKYGVARLSLFGSILRKDYDPNRSDVDVLIEFSPGTSKSLFKLLQIERELTALIGHKVDLNTPGSLSKYFRDDVLAAAKVLYDAA
jgi:predicted nucleotidyltransferase